MSAWTCGAAFVALTLAMLAGVPPAGIDRAVATAVQAVRTPALDRVMVALTLVGDTRFVLAGMVLVLATLVAAGCRRLAVGSAAVFLAAKVGVPLVKLLVARPRPSAGLVGGPDSFSFPSGHAGGAGVLLGVAALVLVAAHPRSGRIVVPVAALLAAGVAASRVWLNVHWTSDVLAGLLLAAALVSALALRARACGERVGGRVAAAMLAGLVLLHGGYAATNLGTAAAKYERIAPRPGAALAAPLPDGSAAGQAGASDPLAGLPSGMRIFWPG